MVYPCFLCPCGLSEDEVSVCEAEGTGHMTPGVVELLEKNTLHLMYNIHKHTTVSLHRTNKKKKIIKKKKKIKKNFTVDYIGSSVEI